MPMLDEKKRGAVISIIAKKLSGENSYDKLKNHNENLGCSEHSEEKKMINGAEAESSQHGLDYAVDEMMNAFESKNKSGLKSALKSFISMMLHEYKE